jgi:hypothetical protein
MSEERAYFREVYFRSSDTKVDGDALAQMYADGWRIVGTQYDDHFWRLLLIKAPNAQSSTGGDDAVR